MTGQAAELSRAPTKTRAIHTSVIERLHALTVEIVVLFAIHISALMQA